MARRPLRMKKETFIFPAPCPLLTLLHFIDSQTFHKLLDLISVESTAMRNLQLGSLLWCHLFRSWHVSIGNWTHVLWKHSQRSQQLSHLFWSWMGSMEKDCQYFKRLCCASQYFTTASLLSLRPSLLHLRSWPWLVRRHCPPGSKFIVPDQRLEDNQCLLLISGMENQR